MPFFGKKKIDTDEKKIDEILNRSVNEIIDKEELKKMLLSGKQLRIKLGIDPTSPDLHLGRATQLLKLKDFQELGHVIVFIVGDTTGVIGDTSDKESERPMLSESDVKRNAKTYFKQAEAILNMDSVEKHYNSEWLLKLSYSEIGEQANQFSVSDFIARENIKKRLDSGTRVSLREVLYPIMQGYDSVAVHADVEIGGTDQRFNILAGRKLQEHAKQDPQQIIMLNLISGLDGRKMSSSWGNTINISDSPIDMYGKIMSLNDELIMEYFVSCTRLSTEEVNEIGKLLEAGTLHPKDAKIRLGVEIVSMYYGEENAKSAQENFTRTFNEGGVPDNTKEVFVGGGTLLVDTLIDEGVILSKSEFRRLESEGAITSMITKEKITGIDTKIEKDDDIKVGKRRFLKIRIKD